MYRFFIMLLAIILAATSVGATASIAAGVTFEFEPLGTVYDSNPPVILNPGDLALTESGINMSVDTFFWNPPGSGTAFNSSEIVAPPNPFAVNTTQALNTNNMNVVFDFTSLSFPVNFVSFEFVDLGGNVNFDVNGIGLQNEASFSTLVSYPDFNVNQTGGLLEITQIGANPIQSLLIGGQELGIDNIRVAPEPATGSLVALGLFIVAWRWTRSR